MSVQARVDINTRSGFLQGSFKSDEATLLTDAGRTVPLANLTVLGKIAASGKLVPIDTSAVDGSQYPYGIYHGAEVATADIVAGDVDLPEVVQGGDGIVDEDAIVIEGTDTLDTLVGSTLKTVRDYFADKGLFFKSVVDVHGYEN